MPRAHVRGRRLRERCRCGRGFSCWSAPRRGPGHRSRAAVSRASDRRATRHRPPEGKPANSSTPEASPPVMTMTDRRGDVDLIVHGVAIRLSSSFPHAEEAEVADLVRAEVVNLADAPVQNYIEILVERRVRDQLRQAHVEGRAPSRQAASRGFSRRGRRPALRPGLRARRPWRGTRRGCEQRECSVWIGRPPNGGCASYRSRA
jgi:hypothetical protein